MRSLADSQRYFILSSAFLPSAPDAPSPFKAPEMDYILRRATANSYLCCPPEVLGILYSASRLSNPDVANAQDGPVEDRVTAGLALLKRARALDIRRWASNPSDDGPDCDSTLIESRVHAGTVHLLATCLYILQAVPGVAERAGGDSTATSLSQGVFDHLASIPEEDPNFKATAWPTFIAGAETADPVRRAWVMHRLRRLAACCPWGFLFTAMDTLTAMWSAEKCSSKRSWVQVLKDPDMNFLLV